MRLASFRALALATCLCLPAAVPFIPVPAQAHGAPDSFADLVQKLQPAVVNISSTTNVQASAQTPDIPGLPPGSPFEQFFKDFLNRHKDMNPGDGQDGDSGDQSDNSPAPRRMQSLGSGFIVDPSGIVVTNNHVIDGADEVTVTLQDNTILKATVLGHDDRTDLAVLKVKPDKPLPSVTFGDSDTSRVGDWVLAIGNPFGLGGSVTAGIVSARGRDIRQGPYDDFLQTDAAINRGNSGGPLFNMNGEVIGVNTAIYSPSGGSIGIGFAIPANMAKLVVDQLEHYGHPRRGWLGVRIQEMTPDIAESLGLHEADGAMVAGVNDDGPAQKAHIQNGDVILSFNNQTVKEMRNLPRIVAETAIDHAVPVVVWRDGKQQTLTVTVAEQPDDQPQAQAAKPVAPKANPSADLAGLGLKVMPITDEARQKYQISADQKGVLVSVVAASSPAASRGIKAGDVIVEVQQKPVNTPVQVQQRLAELRRQERKAVLLLIQGQDGLRWVPLPLEHQPG